MHNLLAWTCVLLFGAGAFLRPGMVLCISDHGHVRLETNCNTACETICEVDCAAASAGEWADEASSLGMQGGCRDLAMELNQTTLERVSKLSPAFAPSSDLPVALLAEPVALAIAGAPWIDPGDVCLRRRGQLSVLRAIVMQV